jgi:hypothetical protein
MVASEALALPGAVAAMWIAWGLLRASEVPAAMRATRQLADRVIARRGAGVVDAEGLAQVQRALFRASRLVPRSDCKERALAGRLLLAWRGVGSRVVVGFRREGRRWEGHAWVEVDGGGRLFMEGGGSRAVFHERDL